MNQIYTSIQNIINLSGDDLPFNNPKEAYKEFYNEQVHISNIYINYLVENLIEKTYIPYSNFVENIKTKYDILLKDVFNNKQFVDSEGLDFYVNGVKICIDNPALKDLNIYIQVRSKLSPQCVFYDFFSFKNEIFNNYSDRNNYYFYVFISSEVFVDDYINNIINKEEKVIFRKITNHKYEYKENFIEYIETFQTNGIFISDFNKILNSIVKFIDKIFLKENYNYSI